ncbi:hypothetical protein Hanom_Chr15g01371341 [Helianthus anomalus]
MEAVPPQGKGDLGALGDPDATGVPKNTWRNLGVLGGGAAASGSSAGSKPTVERKRKGDATGAGGQKGPKLRRTQPQEEIFSLFDVPPSPSRDAVADVGVNKEFRRSPSIEVVTLPSAHAEDTGKKAAGQTIVDTPNSPVAEKTSCSTTAGTGVGDQPSIRPGETELEFYYRSYTEDQSVDYHCPPWTVMQGDDISNDPSACRDILSGLGTPFEVLRARGLPRENQINQISFMLVGSSIMANAIIEDYKVLGRKEEEIVRLRAEAEATAKAAREGAEQLEREKVRTLAKLLSDERKGWREACARENEKRFRVRQELSNLKVANAALVKEKAATEAAAKEAREAKAHGAKALEEAVAECNNLNKVVEDLKAEVKNRVTILEEVTARATEAEARAREDAEASDSLTISLDQLREDRDWIRDHDCRNHS